MAIQKRTQKEIEKDSKRIKEAAKTATTMKELENLTGLSYAMINTTLSKHPTIFKRIKEQLAVNKEKWGVEAQNKKNLGQSQKQKKKQKNVHWLKERSKIVNLTKMMMFQDLL